MMSFPNKVTLHIHGSAGKKKHVKPNQSFFFGRPLPGQPPSNTISTQLVNCPLALEGSYQLSEGIEAKLK